MNNHQERRGAGSGSLLSLTPARDKKREEGSLLSFPASPSRDEETAAQRHARARQRRQSHPQAQPTAQGADRSTKYPTTEDELPSQDEPSLLERILRRGKNSTAPMASHSAPAASEAASDLSSAVQRVDAVLRRQQADMDRLANDLYADRDEYSARPPFRDGYPVAEHGQLEDDGWRPLIDPMRVINGVVDARMLIVVLTVLGGVLGGIVAASTPKQYQATAEIIIDPRDLRTTERPLTDVTGLPSDSTIALVENQVRILTSSGVLNKVVDELGLENDPNFNGEGGVSLNPLNVLRGILSGSDGASAMGIRRATTVTNLSESVSVERTGRTFAVLVNAKTTDAETSAKIANSMVKNFLIVSGELQSRSAGRANSEVVAQLERLRKEVEAAEQKVETYRAENDLVGAQGRLISDDEILKLNDQLGAARARTIDLNARADSARTMSVDAVVGGAIPEAGASSAISELRSQYATAKQEADRISVRLGPRHPSYQSAQAQLSALQGQISNELRRVSAQVQTELKRSVQLEQDLGARLAQLKVRQGDLSSEMVALRDLERDAQAKRSVYEGYLLRANETSEQKEINSANVTVVSEATPPLKPAGTSRVVVAAMGAFLGFLAGVGIGGGRAILGSLSDTYRESRNGRSSGQEPFPTEPNPTGGRKTRRRDEEQPVPEDNSMNPFYPPHGYAPYPQQAHGQQHPYAPPQPSPYAPQTFAPAPQHMPAAQQPYYGQPVQPYMPTGPQPYPPQNYAPPIQPAPVYPPQAYAPQAAAQGWPQAPVAPMPAPQPVYVQPVMPPPQAYAQPLAQDFGHYPQQAQHQVGYPRHSAPDYERYAPQQAPAYHQQGESSEALANITDTVREFRDAVRELADTRQRRRYY